jgi:hypothetical protein
MLFEGRASFTLRNVQRARSKKHCHLGPQGKACHFFNCAAPIRKRIAPVIVDLTEAGESEPSLQPTNDHDNGLKAVLYIETTRSLSPSGELPLSFPLPDLQ